jgi:ketosteroid isomerase-like protein
MPTPVAEKPRGADAAALEVVDRFYDAYGRVDVEAMLGMFHEDAVFEDPTFHLRASNRNEFRSIVQQAAQVTSNARFERFNAIVAAPWVVVQHLLTADILVGTGERRHIRVRGAAIFEVRNGLISHWHDYADVLAFQEQIRASSLAPSSQ